VAGLAGLPDRGLHGRLFRLEPGERLGAGQLAHDLIHWRAERNCADRGEAGSGNSGFEPLRNGQPGPETASQYLVQFSGTLLCPGLLSGEKAHQVVEPVAILPGAIGTHHAQHMGVHEEIQILGRSLGRPVRRHSGQPTGEVGNVEGAQESEEPPSGRPQTVVAQPE
jgi:hypothetical protein